MCDAGAVAGELNGVRGKTMGEVQNGGRRQTGGMIDCDGRHDESAVAANRMNEVRLAVK